MGLNSRGWVEVILKDLEEVEVHFIKPVTMAPDRGCGIVPHLWVNYLKDYNKKTP